MEEGDSEANYAYYALHKLKIRPKDFVEMDKYEKAVVIAYIDIKIDSDKKQASKLKR